MALYSNCGDFQIIWRDLESVVVCSIAYVPVIYSGIILALMHGLFADLIGNSSKNKWRGCRKRTIWSTVWINTFVVI